MTIEDDLSRSLAEAHRNRTKSVDQSLYADIDRAAAYRVQQATLSALGVSAGMYKVAVAPDGSGMIAPIEAQHVGNSGELELPAAPVTGLEVEIGVVLARDLRPGSDRAAVEAAIERYFVGMEICGTRYLDRNAAGPGAALADRMSALGYAIGANWPRGTDIDGLEVVLRVDDTEIHRAPAKHGFGGVLEALVAYAKLPEHPYELTAGTIVTTGSMCGLVPANATGTATAEFGGQIITARLV